MTFICIYYVSHEIILSFDLTLKNLFFHHTVNQGNVHYLKSRHKLKLHSIYSINSLDINVIYVLFAPNLVYRLDIQFYLYIIWDQYVYKFVPKYRPNNESERHGKNLYSREPYNSFMWRLFVQWKFHSRKRKQKIIFIYFHASIVIE